MNKEKQIEEMAREMCHLSAECKTCQICNERYHGDDDDLCYFQCVAKEIINHGYRKQSEVIDEFAKRLLDAFPEGNRDNRCPAIYYDDYRYIIEELAEKMKGGAE